MHAPAADRYQQIGYARCGRSGLHLPRISLGLWQNFGGALAHESARDMVLKSFDRGITHFDLANKLRPAARLSRGELRPYPGAGPGRPS